jgi:6-hydroxycyclohex-1-ene-1-carbonyl-CoA dehydrogenase
MQITGWMADAPGATMRPVPRLEQPGPGEVLVAVAGCGVCHTDLGFYYDGVPTRHPFPLCLGHEVSGTIVDAGPGAESWLGRPVVVPAVMPCGACTACLAGRGAICPSQIFPGNDVHGGFATHLRVPARGLCAVPDLADARENPTGLDLPALSVLADAVSTPYQAIVRSGLAAGDVAVFVGVGGVGGFGVQIAAALGAAVAAIDVNGERLEKMTRFGASAAWRADRLDHKALRAAVRAFADERGVPSWRTRIFETSGTPAGQVTAFGLLGPGGLLSVVGFTPARVEIRLSNLMAFDATAQGNWGCLPSLYPDALALCLSGRVRLDPFIERRPLASINDTFADVHAGRVGGRIVLVPEAKP